MPPLACCEHCHNHYPITVMPCPHCAGRGQFPNVMLAELEEEVAALARRYKEAWTDAEARGALDRLLEFEAALADTEAVFARSTHDLQRLSTSDNQAYVTYYDLLRSKIKLPAGDKWDRLRMLTDSALFLDAKDEIRFAALALKGADEDVNLSNYGDCTITLRTEMIAHRASVFEENSVMFMIRRGMTFNAAVELPHGFRAPWDYRSLLCAAKLARSVTPACARAEYAGLLLRQGATGEDDEFVEVHIWGSMTARTIARVTLKQNDRLRICAIIDRANFERLKNIGVHVTWS
jgi:hypothetical protein